MTNTSNSLDKWVRISHRARGTFSLCPLLMETRLLYIMLLVIVLTKAAPPNFFNIIECRISSEVKLCTGNDRLCFQTLFCYLTSLVILNTSGKRKLTGFISLCAIARFLVTRA